MLRNLIPALTLALAACGTARIIQMTPAGGTIELQGDRSKAMEQATADMNAKCGPSNFTIVGEGDEPVGTSTATGSNSETTSTGQQMAWRIHFQCNGAIGGGPAPMDPTPATVTPTVVDPAY